MLNKFNQPTNQFSRALNNNLPIRIQQGVKQQPTNQSEFSIALNNHQSEFSRALNNQPIRIKQGIKQQQIRIQQGVKQPIRIQQGIKQQPTNQN